MDSFAHRIAVACFLAIAVITPRTLGQPDERRYPHDLAWSDAEMRRIQTLARTIPKAADNYWTVERAGIQVRSNVSAELAAEAVCYAEPLVREFPKLMGLPPLRKRVRFIFTFHDSESRFAEASDGANAADGYGRIRSEDGEAFVAEIHLCAADKTATGSSGDLGKRTDLGVLQYRLARALLQLHCKPGQSPPPFLGEGCATYFENYNTRKGRSTGRKPAVRLPRPSFRHALRTAMLDDATFLPSLFDALHQSRDSFEQDADLNGALADSFVDFLLTSSRHRSALRKLLTHALQQEKDDTDRLTTPEGAAALESDWHCHLCGIVASALPVLHDDLPVEGSPPRMASVTKLSAYGNKPLVSVMAAENGACDVAYYDGGGRTIRIVQCDAGNRKTGEITLAFVDDASALLGAARLPDGKGYAVGFSRDNEHGDRGFEFWIARCDPKGKRLSETRIFGDKKSDEVWSKGGPGGAGTARIAYNDRTGKIGFYLSHNMKWKDGVRHQGGYIGFLDEGGKQIMAGSKPLGNGWFFSHNFDQRLLVAGGNYYALAHGDAYPRALGFSKWTDSGGKASLLNTRYYEIPGRSGDNTTHCQTGGLTALSDGSFAVLFATSNDRPSHDVCIKVIAENGSVKRERWLTSYPQGQYGAYPRIARFGDDILVAWEEVGGMRGGATLQLMTVDYSLETVFHRTPVEDVHVSPYGDFVNLDNGAAAWAFPSGGNEIRVCRIDRPQVLEERLVKLMAARQARRANAKRTPKRGAVEGIDGKMLGKLAELDGAEDLLGGPVRLSISKTAVSLVEAAESGSLRFSIAGGRERKSASFRYHDLPFGDKAALALALLRREPDNRTLYGVAGFYLECAGNADRARLCYDKAGSDTAGKFAALFAEE